MKEEKRQQQHGKMRNNKGPTSWKEETPSTLFEEREGCDTEPEASKRSAFFLPVGGGWNKVHIFKGGFPVSCQSVIVDEGKKGWQEKMGREVKHF